jgi:hypothetical protein
MFKLIKIIVIFSNRLFILLYYYSPHKIEVEIDAMNKK